MNGLTQFELVLVLMVCCGDCRSSEIANSLKRTVEA
jgi:hypothetical protein